jgi:hypothetical protein
MTLPITLIVFATGALFAVFAAGAHGAEGLLGKALPAVLAMAMLAGALALGAN